MKSTDFFFVFIRSREKKREKSKSREKEREKSKERVEKKRSRSRERSRDKSRERKRRERDRERRSRSRDRKRRSNSPRRPFRRGRTPPNSASRAYDRSDEDIDLEERDSRTIFCMQLSQRIRARDLEEFFSSVGKVRDVRLITCNKTKRFKGIAYIEFKSSESVALVSSNRFTFWISKKWFRISLFLFYFILM